MKKKSNEGDEIKYCGTSESKGKKRERCTVEGCATNAG